MDYEKKYKEALERAKAAIDMAADKDLVKGVATTIFPELRESEDERMMREFNDWLCEEIECRTNDLRDEKDRRTLNMLCYILTKVKDWLEKQQESLHVQETCKENADSFTSENERILTWLITRLKTNYNFKGNYWAGKAIEYLEKQKEQRPVDDTAFEKWLDDWYQGSKGISGYVVMNEAEFKNWSRGIKNMYQQKLDIALIQRSWYMEGYHDREFGKEPMWLVTTGEGGPKYKLNPKYGQPLAETQNPSWKPSEEQMKALEGEIRYCYACGMHDRGRELQSLCEQLKKL